MGLKIGAYAKILYGGTNARASWPSAGAAAALTVLNRVGDVKLPMEKGKEDSTTRDSNGWETFFAALIAGGVDFQLKYDTSDAGYQALRLNYCATSGATIQMAILDGDTNTSGVEGLWMDAQIFKFEKGENIKGIQTVDVNAAPSLAYQGGTNMVGPQWIRIGTGPITG